MANGPVVAFIGTRSFSYNVAIANSGVIRPEAAATPSALAKVMLNTKFNLVHGSLIQVAK